MRVSITLVLIFLSTVFAGGKHRDKNGSASGFSSKHHQHPSSKPDKGKGVSKYQDVPSQAQNIQRPLPSYTVDHVEQTLAERPREEPRRLNKLGAVLADRNTKRPPQNTQQTFAQYSTNLLKSTLDIKRKEEKRITGRHGKGLGDVKRDIRVLETEIERRGESRSVEPEVRHVQQLEFDMQQSSYDDHDKQNQRSQQFARAAGYQQDEQEMYGITKHDDPQIDRSFHIKQRFTYWTTEELILRKDSINKELEAHGKNGGLTDSEIRSKQAEVYDILTEINRRTEESLENSILEGRVTVRGPSTGTTHNHFEQQQFYKSPYQSAYYQSYSQGETASYQPYQIQDPTQSQSEEGLLQYTVPASNPVYQQQYMIQNHQQQDDFGYAFNLHVPDASYDQPSLDYGYNAEP